jgi:hypothetical protein
VQEREPVCIDKRYSERPYQVVVPQRRFAGTVVTGENDRERFVPGDRLEQIMSLLFFHCLAKKLFAFGRHQFGGIGMLSRHSVRRDG